MSALWKAMLEAQKEIKHAIKDSKNPHLRNKYASLNSVLDEVKPVLNKHGLVLTQKILESNLSRDLVCVSTTITHAETGEKTEDLLPVPIKHKFKDGADLGTDAQELGSAITYGRRYGLLAMCAIASEDDDGEAAVVGVPAKPEEQKLSEEKKSELSGKLGKALGWKPLNG